MIDDKITQQAVGVMLAGDDSSHGMDHIRRVYDMSMRFAKEMDESVDFLVVGLTAQLRDADDYRLAGWLRVG